MILEQIFKFNLAGRELIVETGKMAQQANGSVLMRYGDTTVLVTATASAEPREGVDFFPLTVDYEERLYAVGKIPGGFIKREGRPSEKAILSARLIDRPIRPLFPEGFRNDVQIIATVLSVDQDNPPDVLAMIGASAALSISDIPFNGPIGAVSVGMVDGKLIINPNQEQSQKSQLRLVVAGTKEAVLMVEAGANEVSEEDMLKAIKLGHQEIKKIVEFLEEIVDKIGKPKMELNLYTIDKEIEEKVRDFAADKIIKAIQTSDKLEREDNINKVNEETLSYFKDIYQESFNEVEKDIKDALYKLLKENVRKMILEESIRPDGRKLDEIRPISCEVGLFKRVHGSGLFTRGQTQVLT
ncbi:MAG: polyribonucleotide nucleotidyltransferase, partial [Thermosediminibacterales bacterium]|nr:polyribonucleotide nucleotidyltransferase [Thermosediminibacterales bacterium]